VKRVGEIVACGRRTGDCDGSLRKRGAIESEEALPGIVAAESAGVSEREIGEMQRAEE
jgi:hypothetical protein